MASNSLSSSSSSTTIFQREIPSLDKTNYRVWKIWMETHLRCLGNEIWEITEKGYIRHNPTSRNPPSEGVMPHQEPRRNTHKQG